MTIVALELGLIAFDYLLFLFAPLIKHLMQRLGLKRSSSDNGGTYDCSFMNWLTAENQSDDSRSPSKRGQQLSLLDRLDREIQDYYRWQQDELTENLEERVSALKRAEAMIRAKWPWIGSHTTLIDPIDRQLNCWTHDLCIVADWDFPTLLSTSSLLPDSDESDGTNCNDKNMRIIHSNAAERKFSLKIESLLTNHSKFRRLSAGDKTPDVAEAKKESILCIRWLTKGEFSLEADRSSLVFYYTQVLPDLAPLHSILVELVDGAQLIESSPNETHALDKCGSENQLKPLTRYQLLLMLVAYLQRHQQENKDGPQTTLSAKLAGFLSTYSRLASSSISIRPASGRSLSIDLAEKTDVELLVCDPVLMSAEKPQPEMRVEVSKRLGELFSILSQQMSSDRKDGRSSMMRSLFKSALRFGGRENEYEQLEETLSTRSEECQPLLAENQDSAYISNPKKTLKLENNKLTWDSTILKGFWAQLKWRKILTNALYLMLLLLVRNMMLNYLENVQRDLQAEANDDLVELRKIIFDSSHSQQQQQINREQKSYKAREPEDLILDEEELKGNRDSTTKSSVNSQSTLGEPAMPDMGGAGLDGLMESMMQQMFANIASSGEGSGLDPEEMKRFMALLKGEDDDGSVSQADEEAKMAELKKFMEKITGKPISDEELNADFSEEDLARQLDSLNLGAFGLDDMDDYDDDDEGEEDVDGPSGEEPAISTESPPSVKDEL